jgi:small subunit ribosomal protein S1
MANFGAFIDIGGVEGLVHLSELSWKRVNHPSELLKVGDTVKAYVLNIDQERQRIALSIKRLEADPWTIIDETYRVGQLVEAEITRLTKFGAFARLNDDYELEGLIHISEMSEDRIDHPREVVKPEDKVMVRIIRIDPDQRQIGLSLRQVASEKYIESDLALLDAG